MKRTGNKWVRRLLGLLLAASMCVPTIGTNALASEVAESAAESKQASEQASEQISGQSAPEPGVPTVGTDESAEEKEQEDAPVEEAADEEQGKEDTSVKADTKKSEKAAKISKAAKDDRNAPVKKEEGAPYAATQWINVAAASYPELYLYMAATDKNYNVTLTHDFFIPDHEQALVVNGKKKIDGKKGKDGRYKITAAWSGDGSYIFWVTKGSELTVSDWIIDTNKHLNTAAAVYADGGKLTMTNCEIKNAGNSETKHMGAGVCARNGANVTLETCSIHDCYGLYGVGIDSGEKSVLTIEACNIYNIEGGTGVVLGHKTSGSNTISIKGNTKIHDNYGGIANRGGIVDFQNGAIYNTAASGVSNDKGENHPGGTITISGGEIHNTGGHGVSVSAGMLNVSGGKIYKGEKHGIYLGGGTVNVSGGEVYENGGDGVHAAGGSVTVTGKLTSHDNSGHGVNTAAPCSINNANVYGNGSDGVHAAANINIYGGDYYNNEDNNIQIDGSGHTLTIIPGKYNGTDTGAKDNVVDLYGSNEASLYVSGGASLTVKKGTPRISEGGIDGYNCTNIRDGKNRINMSGKGSSATLSYVRCWGGTGTDNGIYVGKEASVTTKDQVEINANPGNGVSNHGTATLGGLSSHDNGGKGVWNEGTATITGGTIKNQEYNVQNKLGTLTISGGTITGASKSNVQVSGGEAKMSGGTISGAKDGYGITTAAGATFTLSGGKICDNKNGGIQNKGTLHVTGGSVCCSNPCTSLNKNANGIINEGTANISGAYTSYNNYYGIYQKNGTLNQTAAMNAGSGGAVDYQYSVYLKDGAYKMSQNASVPERPDVGSIYLCPGKYVTVAGKLNASSLAGCLNCGSESSDRNAGRVMGKVWDGSYQTAESMVADDNRKYTLAFKTLTSPKGAKTEMRPGNGKNGGAVGTFVLSSTYNIMYHTCLEGYDLKNIVIEPAKGDDYNKHFYKEGQKFAPVTVKTKDGKDISKALVFLGWNTKEDGSGVWYLPGKLYEGTELEAPEAYKDGLHLYARWALGTNAPKEAGDEPEEKFSDGFTMAYDRNIDTAKGETPAKDCGENYSRQIHTMVGGNVTFDENTFAKERIVNMYDDNLYEYVDYQYKYSFQGWSFDPQAVYTNAGIYQPKDTADALRYLDEALGTAAASVKDGRVTVINYVVWDEYPFITAYDVYLYDFEVTEEADKGTLEQRILEEAFAKAADKEDGDIKDLKIWGFQESDYRFEGENNFVKVNVEAVDGAGNISHRLITVYVTPMISHERDNYVRFISKEAYYLTKPDGTPDEEAGALSQNSIWYQDPECRAEIEAAFEMIANGGHLMQFTFTRDDIKASQEFCERGMTESIKNGTYHDFLGEWLKMFAHCRTK